MIIVQIVGGPNDGKWIQVPDGTRTIKFASYSNVGGFTEETEPTETIMDKIIILPIKLTRKGYRVFWP